MKLLVLSPIDRLNCFVTYNVNRFEVYHATGYMLTAASTKKDLKEQLLQNGIKAVFDASAVRHYLG